MIVKKSPAVVRRVQSTLPALRCFLLNRGELLHGCGTTLARSPTIFNGSRTKSAERTRTNHDLATAFLTDFHRKNGDLVSSRGQNKYTCCARPPRCGSSAGEPEGYPGHGGNEDGKDEPPLPGLGTDPVADPLGSEPRLLGR